MVHDSPLSAATCIRLAGLRLAHAQHVVLIASWVYDVRRRRRRTACLARSEHVLLRVRGNLGRCAFERTFNLSHMHGRRIPYTQVCACVCDRELFSLFSFRVSTHTRIKFKNVVTCSLCRLTDVFAS